MYKQIGNILDCFLFVLNCYFKKREVFILILGGNYFLKVDKYWPELKYVFVRKCASDAFYTQF